MDSLSENEFNTHIDIETGLGVGVGGISEEEGEDAEEGEEQRTVYSKKTCCRSLVRIDGSSEITMSSSSNVVVLDDVKLFETRTKVVKEKKSSKKPPRPPRSSKPLSLDAADQKLIKEISQLIILKRARVERIKALKVKSAKASSSSGNLFAMICTILFCVLFIFQGVSSGRRIDTTTTTGFQSSQVSTEIAGHGHELLPIPPLNYDSRKTKVEEDADATS